METPIWLNLGAGGNILPAPWQNHDFDMDITKPLPFADNSVERILGEHVCEHIDSANGARFFKEAFRILKPDGVLRVCVPVLNLMMTREHIFDLCTGHGHQQIYSAESLRMFLYGAGFEMAKIDITDRRSCDGHWKVIGEDKDRLETLRMEATK